MTSDGYLARLNRAHRYVEDPRNECLASWDPFTGWEINKRGSVPGVSFVVTRPSFVDAVETVIRTTEERDAG